MSQVNVGDSVYRFSGVSWWRHRVAECKADKRRKGGQAVRLGCEEQPLTSKELRRKRKHRIAFDCELRHVTQCPKCGA